MNRYYENHPPLMCSGGVKISLRKKSFDMTRPRRLRLLIRLGLILAACSPIFYLSFISPLSSLEEKKYVVHLEAETQILLQDQNSLAEQVRAFAELKASREDQHVLGSQKSEKKHLEKKQQLQASGSRHVETNIAQLRAAGRSHQITKDETGPVMEHSFSSSSTSSVSQDHTTSLASPFLELDTVTNVPDEVPIIPHLPASSPVLGAGLSLTGGSRIGLQSITGGKARWNIRGPNVFNILKFGAVGDGIHNDTEAMVQALDAAGRSRGTVLVPGGGYNFLMWPFVIRHSNIKLVIQGIIICPGRLSSWGALETLPLLSPSAGSSSGQGSRSSETSRELQRMRLSFISLTDVANVTITGSGTVDGRGQAWWHLRRQQADVLAPVLLKMERCVGIEVSWLRLVNSPLYHLVAVDTTHLTLSRLFIYAPLSSKNTDGISLMNSSHVVIRDSEVDTGDDNCAVKEGSRDILVERCIFRNGHGSSIGSIGEQGSYGEVRDIVMRDIVFNTTVNAARIKTWQGGTGFIFNITYHNLTVVAVRCPLLIEQFYCASAQHPQPCKNSSDAVQISRVSFTSITGTQTSSAVGQFLCSDARPCLDIHLADIHVVPAKSNPSLESGKAKPWWLKPKGLPINTFKCWNAQGTQERVTPTPCLNENKLGKGVVASGVLSRGDSIGLTTSDNYGLDKKKKKLLKLKEKEKEDTYIELQRRKKKTTPLSSTAAACSMFSTIGCQTKQSRKV